MDWLNLDWLAYFILVVTYAGGVVPTVGSIITQGAGSTFAESWKVGAAVHVFLTGVLAFAGVFCVILWAAFRVL